MKDSHLTKSLGQVRTSNKVVLRSQPFSLITSPLFILTNVGPFSQTWSIMKLVSYKLVIFNENQQFCFMQNLAPKNNLEYHMTQPLIFEAIMGWTIRSSSWGANPHLTRRLKIL